MFTPHSVSKGFVALMEVTSVNLGNLGNNYWVRVSGQLGITYPNILQFPPIPRPSQPVPSVSTTWTSGQLLSSKAWAESRNGGVCTARQLQLNRVRARGYLAPNTIPPSVRPLCSGESHQKVTWYFKLFHAAHLRI